ncbi:MAG: T9SS type A sorting domain-containing protein [Vicingaceae bacterium]
MKSTIFFLFTVLTLSVFSQNLNLDWIAEVNRTGGRNDQNIEDLVIDGNGNTIAIGTFSGTLDFDPDTSAADTFYLSSSGTTTNTNSFVYKLNPSGGLVWVRKLELTPAMVSVATDQNNDLYITGSFDGTVDFDPGLGTSTLTANGRDAFILKLNSNGNFEWVQNYSSSEGKSVDIGPNGNVYYTGNDGPDVFIMKLDSSNGFNIWRKDLVASSSTSFPSRGFGITVDSSLNVYTVGYASADIDFDPSVNNVVYLGLNQQYFAVKLDSNGNYQWAFKDFGAVSIGSDIKLDPSHQFLYSTGYYNGNSYKRVFVNKIDTAGNVLWTNTAGSSDDGEGDALSIDANGSVYNIGEYDATSGGLSFNFNGANNALISLPSGTQGTYIQKMDSNGNLLWVEAVNTNNTGSIYTKAIGVHQNLDLQIGGHFAGTIDMDPGRDTFQLYGGSPPSNQASPDLFTSRLTQCFTTFATDVHTACNSFLWIDGNTYFASTDSATFTTVNTAGCDSIITLDLTLDTVNNAVSQNGIVLTANQNGATYQWLDCNNGDTPISGATSQSYTATTNGDYSVEVNFNNCTDTSNCISVISVGLEEKAVAEEFKIFPNPTQREVNLMVKQEMLGKRLQLFNLSAKLIKEETITAERTVLDLSEFESGVYFLQVEERVEKLIIH